MIVLRIQNGTIADAQNPSQAQRQAAAGVKRLFCACCVLTTRALPTTFRSVEVQLSISIYPYW
jgi:hypothetical protein